MYIAEVVSPMVEKMYFGNGEVWSRQTLVDMAGARGDTRVMGLQLTLVPEHLTPHWSHWYVR